MQDANLEGLSRQLTDLQRCNDEPVRTIGGVQPHGGLVLFRKSDRVIVGRSTNFESMLGISSALGKKLDDVLEGGLLGELDRRLRDFPREGERGLDVECQLASGPCRAYLFQSGEHLGLEIEKVAGYDPRTDVDAERCVRQFLSRAKFSGDIDVLAEHACAAIREILGIERVMMYQFLAPSWHGQVIAESRAPGTHSYFGHRFPASDIPKPARDLYLRNGVRVIADSLERAVPIDPPLDPVARAPWDLTDSRLRAVSPIHLEYLRNMGVRASYSFAVRVDEQLWGLIACHHSEPAPVPRSKRTACEFIAETLSIQVGLRQSSRDQRAKIHFDSKLSSLFSSFDESTDPIDQFFRLEEEVLRTFDASGFAYVTELDVRAGGGTPKRDEILQLADLLRGAMSEKMKRCFGTHHLSSLDAGWSSRRGIVSGVAAVIVNVGGREGLLMMFRPEQIQTITWGGDPRKQLDDMAFTGRIHPRKSFESWEEEIRDRSTEWEEHVLDGLVFVADRIFGIMGNKHRDVQALNEQIRNLRKEK